MSNRRASKQPASYQERLRTAARGGLKKLHLKPEGFEKLLEGVLSMPSHAFYIYDYKKDKMILGEREIAALYGYTPEEIHDFEQGWLSVVHPEDRGEHLSSIQRMIEAVGDQIFAMKTRILRKDGRLEWIACHRRPYERDAHGQVISELGVVQIITRLVENSSALRQSEARYQTIFERAADGIWLMDKEGIIRDANPRMCERLGYNREELIGMHMLETFPKERQKRTWAIVKNSHANGSSSKGIHQRKDGSRVPVEFVISPLLDETQIVIERDITDRLLREEAAKQRDMFYHSLFHNNSSGVARFDAEGHLLEVNPKLVSMLGCNARDLVGNHLCAFMAPGSDAVCKALLHSMQKHQAYPGSLRLRLRGKDADSPDLPVHAANTAFYHHSPAGKKFFEGIIILTDISAQVEIEAAYRRELDLNKALLHHTTAFILVLDPEGRVLYFNESIAKRFGYDLEEVRGQRPWDIGVIDLQDSEFTLQRFQRLISGEDNPATEIRMRTKGGESVLVEVRSTSTRDEHGEVDRIIATAIDVTERDRLQREVLRISEREQTRIGHDLHDGVGQTMTGMISLIDALEASLEGPAKKDAARIKELASESVQEVRRLSHGLSPAAVKNRGLTGALKLLAETVRVNFRTLCDERLQQGMPELDEERETHLFRIAQEAVNNALRHGHPGKVTITLEHSETCGTLMIEDNGKGLRAARMKKASGIGLRVMEYRAQLVQGDVKVVPRPGGGVRMTCRFPIEKMAKKGRRKAV